MAYTVPASLHASLSSLADVLLPFQDWLQTPGRYVPDPLALIPSEKPLPWRSGPMSLNAASLGLIQAFEAWVDGDATDEALAPRWLMLKVHPTAFFQYQTTSVADWRKERGLLPDAAFAPFASFAGAVPNMSYVLARPDSAGDPGDPVPAARYYDECFALLQAAIAAPGVFTNWNDFVGKLKANTAWPTTARVSSLAFLKRFTCDLLIACMGQKNPALQGLDRLWQRAVLIEAGENRHTGNEYGPAQTAHAVEALLDKFNSLPPQP